MKGMQISRNPTSINKHQFLGAETQVETGYIDLQNRQYDPQRGQMTSPDALSELSRRWSPFSYSYNNPIRFSDPDGLYPGDGDTYTTKDNNGNDVYNDVNTQKVVGYGGKSETTDDEKDKGKKSEETKKALPTAEEAKNRGFANGLNPNGDGIEADHTLESFYIGGKILGKPMEFLFGKFAKVLGFGAKITFSTTEKAIIAETKLILKNETLIMKTFETGIGTELKLAGRTVIIEPQAPLSGMTLFEENAFVIGREGFSSRPELIKTILHELYCLQTSTLRGATGIQQAVSQETAAAASFAEKAFSQIK
jgi:RHS repeat-associated protein